MKEDQRSQIVAHEGRKVLTVSMGAGFRDADYAHFAEEMTRKIEENEVDSSLRSWILSDFSTTTTKDTVVASIIRMSTLQGYFNMLYAVDVDFQRSLLKEKNRTGRRF